MAAELERVCLPMGEFEDALKRNSADGITKLPLPIEVIKQKLYSQIMLMTLLIILSNIIIISCYYPPY